MFRFIACLFACLMAAQLVFSDRADARKKVPATPGAQCNTALNSCNSGCKAGVEASGKPGGLASAVYDQSLCLGKCTNAYAKCVAKPPAVAPTGGTVVGCPPGALCAPPQKSKIMRPVMDAPAGAAVR